MKGEQTIRAAIAAKEIVVHSVDFDCRVCGLNFNFTKTKKFSPIAFMLAHLKSCRAAHRTS